MKKSISIGLAAVLLIIILWFLLHPHGSALTGIWIADLGQGRTNTTTIRRDGSYRSLVMGDQNGLVETREGRMDMKDGQLINTLTNVVMGTQTVSGYSQGVMDSSTIIQMDDHTLVIRRPGGRVMTYIKK